MAGRRAAVVGSGPNGLTAACLLARAGWQVTVYESAEEPGGAARSAEILGEGVVSDLGASVHPFGIGSPAYEDLGLGARGLQWAQPGVHVAHALDGEPPALLHSDLEQTAAELGIDHDAWRRLMGPVAERWEQTRRAAMAPPLQSLTRRDGDAASARFAALARLGARGAWPADVAAQLFRTSRARALFAGMAAHSTVPLGHPLTAAFGVLFAAAGHGTGWPVARGGSQAIVDALVAVLTAHGGRIETGVEVTGVHQVPGRARALHRISGRRSRDDGRRGAAFSGEPVEVVLADLTPTQLLRLEGLELPGRYRRALSGWRYGPGIVKVDFLLDGPIPWTHPETAQAGTVHLGGSHAQISASEKAASRGVLSGRPYVLLAQPSAADPTRAPAGQSVGWAYAHVPHGLDGPAAQRAARLIEDEVEAHAPGFRQAVTARKVWTPRDLQAWDANLVGGAVSGGMPTLRQSAARPAVRWNPYSTDVEGIWLCSSSTPPGGGAHGMSGFNAAQAVLREHG